MEKKLLNCEWTILRAMWGEKPLRLGEIIERVKERQPEIRWGYKTYHTYLRVMLEKGIIGCDIISARDKRYFPLITKEEALKAESESLLSRISASSVGRLVAMMAKDGQITESDRQELSALFSQLDGKGGGENDG